jgi:ubiquinone/menaquinone biosynthesis C-methylase UbiE
MPLLNETYEQAHIHSTWTSIYRSPQVSEFNDAVMARLLSTLSLAPKGRVLDAGCGTGVHTERFVNRGFVCTGVDISDHAISVASARLPDVDFLSAPLEDLPFLSESFDCVHCRGVLMHIPEWRAAVRELCRVLKRNGRIAILDGNRSALETWLVRAIRLIRGGSSKLVKTDAGLEFWSQQQGTPFLVRYFSVHYLADALKAHGIKIDQVMAFELFDVGRFPVAFRSMANRLNYLWFKRRMPAILSHGVAIVGTKL